MYKRQDQENNVVASRWTFNDGGTAGVGYGKVASGSVLHMGMQFVGEDEAGNVTGLGFDEGDALDPLHVWWMTRAETALLPNIDGEEVGVLPFYWYLDRATAEDPEAQDLEARPRFTYRLWASDDFTGIYSPVGVWSAWTLETQLADLAPNLAETLRQSGYGDSWILMVVLAADETGNYELWPAADLTLGGGDEVEVIDRTRKNWVRFKLSSGEIDTTIAYELWHNATDYAALSVTDGDINFGAAGVVARPDPSSGLRVEGLFRIGVVLPASLENRDIAVRWSLQREGEVLFEDFLPEYYSTTGEIQALQLPYDVSGLIDLDWIPEGRNEVSYVLNAQAFWDENGDGVWDPVERIDTTPASVYFKVVRDANVGDYIGRERQRGKQQIILREE